MLWAIYCIDKADTVRLRDQHMRSHLDYLDVIGHLRPMREPGHFRDTVQRPNG